MAKKNQEQTPGDDQVPTAAPVEPRKGSRHKARRMVSLSPREYELLRQLAGRNKRPIAWEARIAIHNALVEAGLMSREEADSMERDT